MKESNVEDEAMNCAHSSSSGQEFGLRSLAQLHSLPPLAVG
jgi:hypothetical protein